MYDVTSDQGILWDSTRVTVSNNTVTLTNLSPTLSVGSSQVIGYGGLSPEDLVLYETLRKEHQQIEDNERLRLFIALPPEDREFLIRYNKGNFDFSHISKVHIPKPCLLLALENKAGPWMYGIGNTTFRYPGLRYMDDNRQYLLDVELSVEQMERAHSQACVESMLKGDNPSV